MKRAIIGCSMIREDIEKLLENLPYEADIVWMDEHLHAVPSKLHDALQEKIDELKDYDEIILTYLLCGNALLGIKSDSSVLRFLRGDDCIYADLCLREDYSQVRFASIFLSHGWLGTERNGLSEYEKSVERYGEKRARHIWDVMYKNYKNLVYMKLDSDDDTIPEEDRERVNRMAELTNLQIKCLRGSTEMYARLLSLAEDPGIAVIEKGHEITVEDTKAVK